METASIELRPPSDDAEPYNGRRRPSPTALVFVVGTALILLWTGVLLLRPGARLVASNTRVRVSRVHILVAPNEERCQRGEYVPHDAARVRMYAGLPAGGAGPSLTITVLDRGRRAGSSTVAGGYHAGPVDAQLRSASTVEGATVCIRNEGPGPVTFAGNLSNLSVNAVPASNTPAQRPTDEVRLDYFRAGRPAIWRMLPDIADRFTLFKPGVVGPATLPAVFLLVCLGCVGAGSLVVRDPWRASDPVAKLPRTAIACAVLMLVNGVAWSLVTPLLQAPDEIVHVGYVEVVSDTGKLPGPVAVTRQRDVAQPARSEHWELFKGVPFNVDGNPSWSPRDAEDLRRVLDTPGLPEGDAYAAGSAASGPPLYYLPLVAVDRALGGWDAIDRIFVMRLVTALMAATTALFVYLFAREAIPGAPKSWMLAGLAVAFHPVVTFLAGGVINDNLLIPLAAAFFFAVAYAFRRGLSPLGGVAIGATFAFGYLAKDRMVLLAPGVAVAMAVLVLTARSQRGRAVMGAATAALTAVSIYGAWQIISRAVLHRATGLDRTTGAAHMAGTVSARLSYVWQFFLPRLPFMTDAFPKGTYPQRGVWEVYIQGFVGRFGWFEFGFPSIVNQVGLVVLVALAVLAVRAVLHRMARDRVLELLTYAAFAAGMLVLIGVSGYNYRIETGFNLEQTRYLFPCLALYGGAVGLAVRAAGRRAPIVPALLVVLFSAHLLASLGLSVGRYYA